MQNEKIFDFDVKEFRFSDDLFREMASDHYVKDNWPHVYLLKNERSQKLYVGETTDTINRMKAHRKTPAKAGLDNALFISSPYFNKSATLEIESNLIKYFAGDGKYELINSNQGMVFHSFYEKDTYWRTFLKIWDDLRSRGIALHSTDQIANTDLFKYSPYKSLTVDQTLAINQTLEYLLDENVKNIVIEGGAGTGKTILASYLFKLIHDESNDEGIIPNTPEETAALLLRNRLKEMNPSLKMGLIIPMTSFRSTIQTIFQKISGLKKSMVIGPAQVADSRYDILVVDESHRLRKRVKLGAYIGAFDKANKKLGFGKEKGDELDWINLQSSKAVFFYDPKQSIKPSDVSPERFDLMLRDSRTRVIRLKNQIRCKAGTEYNDFVHKLLRNQLQENLEVTFKEFDLYLFQDIRGMAEAIRMRELEYGLCRLVAGFSWPWISKKNDKLKDIEIDGKRFRWNSVASDWVNSKDAREEVGCIHTVQGYDLNYVGVIFGREIDFDPESEEIRIYPSKYLDRNGKLSKLSQDELREYILNIYSTLMLRGIKGAYLFACNKNLSDYLAKFVQVFPEERKREIEILADSSSDDGDLVPFYDFQAAAGYFGSEVFANIGGYVRVPGIQNKNRKDYFVCRVAGESMNKVIENGDFCLFKKDTGGSRNGKIVLVESYRIQEYEGSRFTVKEYHSSKIAKGDAFQHTSISLKPLSNDSKFQTIVLEEDAEESLNVAGIFVQVLK